MWLAWNNLGSTVLKPIFQLKVNWISIIAKITYIKKQNYIIDNSRPRYDSSDDFYTVYSDTPCHSITHCSWYDLTGFCWHLCNNKNCIFKKYESKKKEEPNQNETKKHVHLVWWKLKWNENCKSFLNSHIIMTSCSKKYNVLDNYILECQTKAKKLLPPFFSFFFTLIYLCCATRWCIYLRIPSVSIFYNICEILSVSFLS